MIKKILRKVVLLILDGNSRLKEKESPFQDLEYPVSSSFNEKPIFISGSGRSGTHMFAKLFELHDKIDSYHLDTIGHSVGDSFYKFVKWHDLPVSLDGLIESRKFLAGKATKEGKRYLESNPVISLCLEDLYEGLDSKVIISVRNPQDVVRSHYQKGWYKNAYPEYENIPGYHYNSENSNHAFSRIVPRTENEYARWLKLTRFGKCAWMWKNTYKSILNQLRQVNHNNYRILYLNTFDYDEYGNICDFLDIEIELNEKKFTTIVNAKPGASNKPSDIKLSEQSKKEFNQEVAPLLEEEALNSLPKEDWLF